MDSLTWMRKSTISTSSLPLIQNTMSCNMKHRHTVSTSYKKKLLLLCLLAKWLTALHKVSRWSSLSFWLASSLRSMYQFMKLGDSTNFLWWMIYKKLTQYGPLHKMFTDPLLTQQDPLTYIIHCITPLTKLYLYRPLQFPLTPDVRCGPIPSMLFRNCSKSNALSWGGGWENNKST